MKLKPDCVPCILKMSITAIRKQPLRENEIEELYEEILEIPSMRGLDWNVTPPEVIEVIWQKIVAKMLTTDPFYSEKADQNKKILSLYPALQIMVNQAEDPLELAVTLAILGNSLDSMVADTSLTIEHTIADRVKTPLPDGAYPKFKQQLSDSGRLVYFGDNAGEIVFDKLLIETIGKMHSAEIAYVVRSTPTLNDATLTEARAVGMDQIVRVVENGIIGPLPGTVLNRCSRELNDLVHQADLIISKGGGNWDTLDEERQHLKKKISFLLLSKCHPHHATFGVNLYRPILANYY